MSILLRYAVSVQPAVGLVANPDEGLV